MKPEQDSSLQAASLRRAIGVEPPHTLTPYEWEQWYAQYGVPDSHRAGKGRGRSWWKRLWRKASTTATFD